MDKAPTQADGTDDVISKLASFKEDAFLNVIVKLEDDSEPEETEVIKENINNKETVNHEQHLTIQNNKNNDQRNNAFSINNNSHIKNPVPVKSYVNATKSCNTITYINPLDIVSENLIGFIKMHTYMAQSTTLNVESIRFRLKCYKYYYYNLSYHIVLEKLLPKENDSNFIKKFILTTIQKSEMNIDYDKLEHLFKDMLKWTKERFEKLYETRRTKPAEQNIYDQFYATEGYIEKSNASQLQSLLTTDTNNMESSKKRTDSLSNNLTTCPVPSKRVIVQRQTTQENSQHSIDEPGPRDFSSSNTQEPIYVIQDDTPKPQSHDISRSSISRDSGVSSPIINFPSNQMTSNYVQEQKPMDVVTPILTMINPNKSCMPSNSQFITPNGTNSHYMPSNGSNTQYMPQNGSNSQYMLTNGSNTQQYMPLNGLKSQYVTQNGSNSQYMPPNGSNMIRGAPNITIGRSSMMATGSNIHGNALTLPANTSDMINMTQMSTNTPNIPAHSSHMLVNASQLTANALHVSRNTLHLTANAPNMTINTPYVNALPLMPANISYVPTVNRIWPKYQ